MKRIQTFRMFESQVTLTEEQEAWLNKCTRGSWSLNPAGEVDVNGYFECFDKGLEDFMGVKFGRVSGNFRCHENKLTSLVGAPREVGGDFWCYLNKLTSLEGAPEKVGGGFYCGYNSLTSLEGAPQEVGEGFSCNDNKLTSLEGAPQEVGGGFSCEKNKLTSLEGAPQEVGGGFSCDDNRLTSLVGAPREVKGDFWCSFNWLTSLKGAPREVKGRFSCFANRRLTSLEGAPEKVGGDFFGDYYQITKGKWGIEGWLDAYARTVNDGNDDIRKLLLTLMSPDVINRKMQEAPEQTLIDLRRVFKHPDFAEILAQIRIPDRYHQYLDDMGLLADLGELGF